jgi:hypothetical protein
MHRTMNVQVSSGTPTIYADMNVYRYVAVGELEIENAKEFRWAYSFAHLGEMARGGNTEALEGMAKLRAVEIRDVLNEKFESVGNIVLSQYIDPYLRYQQHLEAIAGYENTDDLMVEPLLRSFGADNFQELSMTPEELCKEVERLTTPLPDEAKVELRERAHDVALKMEETIATHLRERRPIDETRSTMGLTSSARAQAQDTDSPIDAVWNIIEPSVKGVLTKDQFFGFEPHPFASGIPHTQHGAMAGAHTVLNLLGVSPDRGLAKREKIKNIMSDGQHVGMASYCKALLSADKRFCGKASAIYRYIGARTNVLWFKADPNGCVIRLGTKTGE